MRIKSVRIRNFRSIDNLKLDMGALTIICGPNSCGKSNLFGALRVAFQDSDPSKTRIYEDLIAKERDSVGAPLLSFYVDVIFTECPKEVTKLAGQRAGSNVKYQFRAIRTGKVSRKLGDKLLDKDSFGQLRDRFSVVYVPPIRDLAEGIKPFRQILGESLKKARGSRSLDGPAATAREILSERAAHVLADHSRLASQVLGAEGLAIDTSAVDLDGLYESVSLVVDSKGQRVPLEAFGTGHQSAVIMHLYRQLGELSAGDTLYLFEEPDNHLHPTTIRAIGSDLERMAERSQVLITTHSPILLNYFGLGNVKPLYVDGQGLTQLRSITLGGHTDKKLRELLIRYGLRGTEPLLCKRIIVVEGETDATVLRCLIELRCGKTADQLDVVVASAGGKEKVAELCRLLNDVGADWMAVLDWDAVLSKEEAITVGSLTSYKLRTALSAIKRISDILDMSRRRGRKVSRDLDRIKRELENGLPTRSVYFGSCAQSIIEYTGHLTAGETDQIERALRGKRKQAYQDLLKKAHIWIWDGTIEDALLHTRGSEEVVEQSLIDAGQLAGPVTPVTHRRSRCINTIRDLAHEPAVVERVVRDLEKAGKFARTEVNKVFGMSTEGIV